MNNEDPSLSNTAEDVSVSSVKCAKELKITDKHYKFAETLVPLLVRIDRHTFLTVNASDLESQCKEFAVLAKNHSDLISGKYEGGLKIWEGSIDLCKYLIDNDINFEGKKVLELGCGAGIPGLYALQNGGLVDFQDFNPEVLNFMTMPNALLNTTKCNWDTVNDLCRFYGGDWVCILNLLKKNCEQEKDKYDVILSSETIYNPHYHIQLYSIMKNVLKKTGVIYLAGKFYYFGVGGGVAQFEEIVRIDGALQCNSCWSMDEGVKRVILELKWKQET